MLGEILVKFTALGHRPKIWELITRLESSRAPYLAIPSGLQDDAGYS